MSNTIHPGYGAAPYNALTRPRGAVPAGRQGIGFLDMAARAAGQRQAGAVQAAEAPSQPEEEQKEEISDGGGNH